MQEVLCMLIEVYGERSKKFEGFRFKSVESAEPNLAVFAEIEDEVDQPHLFPSFRFCRFYTDDETAGSEGQVLEIDGIFLHYQGTGFSHLPNHVTIDPETYYPLAKRWTAALAADGGTRAHAAAADWMREHGCTEAIQSIDGRFHRLTPFVVILEESDVVLTA